jgi:hypothetical protein
MATQGTHVAQVARRLGSRQLPFGAGEDEAVEGLHGADPTTAPVGFRQAWISWPRRRAGVSLGMNRTTAISANALAVNPAIAQADEPPRAMAIMKAATAPNRPPARATTLVIDVPGQPGGAVSATDWVS